MIQITRLEPSHNGAGQSPPELDQVEIVAIARKQPSRIAAAIDRFLAQRPGFCLGAALSVGIALGWWVKRR